MKLIDILKCTLNSDVYFKSIARLIEALQTRDWEKIKYAFAQEKPMWIDECKKCHGAE